MDDDLPDGSACAICGSRLPAAAAFCPGCGRRVTGADAEPLAMEPRRDPPTPSPLQRRAERLAAGVRARTRIGIESAAAWTAAGPELVRLRYRMRSLRSQFEREQFELGAATYWREEPEAQACLERMRELERQYDEAEREAARVRDETHGRVAEERFAAQPTQVLGAGPVPDTMVASPPDAAGQPVPE